MQAQKKKPQNRKVIKTETCNTFMNKNRNKEGGINVPFFPDSIRNWRNTSFLNKINSLTEFVLNFCKKSLRYIKTAISPSMVITAANGELINPSMYRDFSVEIKEES